VQRAALISDSGSLATLMAARVIRIPPRIYRYRSARPLVPSARNARLKMQIHKDEADARELMTGGFDDSSRISIEFDARFTSDVSFRVNTLRACFFCFCTLFCSVQRARSRVRTYLMSMARRPRSSLMERPPEDTSAGACIRDFCDLIVATPPIRRTLIDS